LIWFHYDSPKISTIPCYFCLLKVYIAKNIEHIRFIFHSSFRYWWNDPQFVLCDTQTLHNWEITFRNRNIKARRLYNRCGEYLPRHLDDPIPNGDFTAVNSFVVILCVLGVISSVSECTEKNKPDTKISRVRSSSNHFIFLFQ